MQLDFIQDAWERKVSEGCNERRLCRRESFTVAFTSMDVKYEDDTHENNFMNMKLKEKTGSAREDYAGHS